MKQTDFSQLFLIKIKQGFQNFVGPLSFKNTRFNLFLVGVSLFFWFSLGTLFSSNSIDLKENEKKNIRVQVINSIAKNKTTYYTLQGTLEALNKVTLKAETTGIIKNINAEKGAELQKDQGILNLSSKAQYSKLREARALVSQRKLEYENAKKLQSNKFRSKTAVAEAKSKLESAQASFDQTQINIEDTKIKAPFNGRVDTRYVQVGDYVKEGQQIIDFVSLDTLLAVVFIAEKDIHYIKLGTQAKIKCFRHSKIGKITFISSIADPNTRTYRVEITVNNIETQLPDGITAAIKIPVGTAMAHIFSPAAIAMDDQGIPGIKTVDKNNKVTFHPINILNHDENGAWVTGLPNKARIITVGQYYVKAGDIVEPITMNEGTNVSDSARH